jgi:hypothetical protein
MVHVDATYIYGYNIVVLVTLACLVQDANLIS